MFGIMRREQKNDPIMNMMERFFTDDWFRPFFAPLATTELASTSMWAPPVNIKETNDAFEIEMELPGVKKGDIDITVENNVLTISGEKKEEKEVKDGNYLRAERFYGSFSRSFTLPQQVKADEISATYKDGVLNVILPKVEESRPKKIKIK